MKGKTLTTIAQTLGIKQEFGNALVTGFESDSRKVAPGTLFFALKGEKSDGHDFLQDVAAQGASGALVSKDYKGEDFGLPLLYVEDVVGSLQCLAQISFAKGNRKVVAVTGSVGKTTTKEFIAGLLEAKFKVAKTPGNSNSQVGLPLSVLNRDGSEEVFVIEMGMSEPGQIERLVRITPPDIGVITKIGVSHAEFFSNGIEGIAAAKAEIFSHPKTKVAIINGHDEHFQALSQLGQEEKVLFPYFDYALKYTDEGVRIQEGSTLSPILNLQFDAKHLLENFTAAVAVARKLGLSWEEIIVQAAKLKPFPKRFEKVVKNGIIFINDSYNASPESMRAALSNLPTPAQGKKKIAVLGEMKELGQYTQTGHTQVGEFALPIIDHLLCYGKDCQPMVDLFSQNGKPAEVFEDFQLLKQKLYEIAEAGDVVLLKGSNSKKLWLLLED